MASPRTPLDPQQAPQSDPNQQPETDLSTARPPTQSFIDTRALAASAWAAFESTTLRLVAIDDEIRKEWAAKRQGQRVNRRKADQFFNQSTKKLMPEAIKDAKESCEELAAVIPALEKSATAAQAARDTLVGRAALEIDVPVMRRCLEDGLAIIEVSEAQLARAEGGGGKQ